MSSKKPLNIQPIIQPFAALMPTREYADKVAAPPYDVVSETEARTLAEGNPWHFLHVSRPEIDLPVGTDPYQDMVYQQASKNLEKMVEAGVLRFRKDPSYYLYELHAQGHIQIGIAAIASVRAYEEGRIRRHELTRPQKEDDRVRHMEALDAQTGPVFLVCRASNRLEAIMVELQKKVPDLDFQARDGIRHVIRIISAPEAIEAVSGYFTEIDGLYIADGHHRSAAAARVAHIRHTANPHHTGPEPYNFFLTVIFPENQVRILDYNRVVRDLGGLSTTGFLRRIGEKFRVEKDPGPVNPGKPGEFGLYLPGQWYRLTLADDQIPRQDPVASLDVSLLTDRLLHPILGIEDLRRDQRIDFVGGVRGLTELEYRVDSGDMAVAFALYPTRIEELLAVADAGLLMPPKSTWFEPKLADGLLSYRI